MPHAQAMPEWFFKLIMTILAIVQRHDGGGVHRGGHGNTNIGQHEVIPVHTLSSISPSISISAPTTSAISTVPTDSVVSMPVTPSFISASKPVTSSSISISSRSSPTNAISSGSPVSSAISSSTTALAAAPTEPAGPPAGVTCPTGTSWHVFEDSMAWHNASTWSFDGADASRVDFKDGMTVAINQTYIYAELATKDKWVAPVTIGADLKAAGVGGIVTTFVLKDNAVAGVEVGAEIDLEIAAYDDAGKKAPTYQMQLPIWKPPTGTAKQAIRLLKSKAEKKGIELIERLYNTFFEDSGNPSAREWAYTYPGYNAREWVHYKLDWSPKSIDWYTQGVQRISFANNKDESFPHTPLPFRTGLWAVSKKSQNADGWAGAVQWEKNPKPAMSIKNVVITGCRADR